MRRSIVLGAMATVVGLGLSAAPAGAGGGGGCHRIDRGAGDTVQLKDMCFGPGVLDVAPGTEVTWTNDDPMVHVVIGTGWALDGELGIGDSGSHRFDETGVYPYTCTLHPGMNGAVIVGGADADVATPVTTDVTTDVAEATPIANERASSSTVGSSAVAAVVGGVAGAGLVTLRGRRRRERAGDAA